MLGTGVLRRIGPMSGLAWEMLGMGHVLESGRSGYESNQRSRDHMVNSGHPGRSW
jgi:hypothetical protein